MQVSLLLQILDFYGKPKTLESYVAKKSMIWVNSKYRIIKPHFCLFSENGALRFAYEGEETWFHSSGGVFPGQPDIT